MDAAGFEAFYAATAQPVAQQVYLMLGNLADAQHAVHIAYARAWRNWGKVSALAAPDAWVRETALRVGRSRRRRFLRGLRGNGRRIPHEALVYAPRDLAVVEALRELPQVERDALVLHHVVGLGPADVSAEMRAWPEDTWDRLEDGTAILTELLPHLLVPSDVAPATQVSRDVVPAATAPGAALAEQSRLGHAGADHAAAGDGGAALPAGDPGDPAGGGAEPAETAETTVHPRLGDPGMDSEVDQRLRRYLREAAGRRRPVLLPAPDVRRRRWRRRYYAVTGMAAMLVAVVAGASVAVTAAIDGLGSTAAPSPADRSAQASGGSASGPVTSSPSPAPSATTPSATPETTAPASPTTTTPEPNGLGTFTLGPTTARASGIPATRKDLGFIDGWSVRDGAVFLAFDRAQLQRDGTIENRNKLLRQLPVAPDVTVRGGRRLPPDLSMAELVGLVDAGAVREVPFVLHYDRNDQVDQVSELLQGGP